MPVTVKRFEEGHIEEGKRRKKREPLGALPKRAGGWGPRRGMEGETEHKGQM